MRLDAAAERFESWLRNDFVEVNTQLEEAYFAARSESLEGRPDLEDTKRELACAGGALIERVAAEYTLDAAACNRYQLLGAVGFYLAACSRHSVDGEYHGSLRSAWSLAQLLGSSLGVAPRYVFAHQSIYNPAECGAYRRFTSLPDEQVFVTHNGLAVLAYQRAADALRRIPPMGVSNPMATYLFEQASASLAVVMRFNRALAETLDVDRFYFNIRPYFKPYRVNEVVHRGANAGDFSAINEVDLLLGLVSAKDPFYQSVLAEKYPFLPPEDQVLMRRAVGEESLPDRLLAEAAEGPPTPPLRTNGELFLAVCRAHGAAYSFHHHQLVKPFLEAPAAAAPPEQPVRPAAADR
ncbi:protein of unknown function [Streptomyces sp. WMMB 322]|nr:protein of unknown function [Streptomyces sp. WMMB 322]